MHLTERHAEGYEQPVVSEGSETAGAPEIEIEITDDMIRAGAKAFYRWQGLEYGDADDAVFAIFMAMVLAAPQLVAEDLSCVRD
jgi:hypothetical protein